jgi:relaxase-like protein
MRKSRLLKGGEVDFKLRRRAAWLNRLHRISSPKRPRSRPKLFAGPERIYDRRSTVKVSYTWNRKRGKQTGRLAAHARYLERKHGHEGIEAGFDAHDDKVYLSERAELWSLAYDKLHWRIILSPDDANRIDMRQHTRDVMAQMEKDLGTELQWVAIEHRNTKQRHVHIILRGVRQEIGPDGKYITLSMPPEYVSRGIREISAGLVQQQLGPRSEKEYLEVRSHGIEGERWTEIDRAIERKLNGNIADYSFASYLSERSKARVDQEIERLAYLEGRGLAQRRGSLCWEIKGDWKQQLRDLQLEKDVIKNRAKIRSQQRGMEREVG